MFDMYQILDGYYTNRYNNRMIDNQKNIQDCALRLFAVRGYDAVGVQEIVDTAGITKPTLYHYFGSKHGLLENILAIRIEPLASKIHNLIQENIDLGETLKHIVAAYFEYANHAPLFTRFMLSLWLAPEESEGHKAILPYHELIEGMLRELFIRGVKQHGNILGREKYLAATFQGMIHTYIGLSLNNRIELDEVLVRQCVHQYMHGILS